MGIATDTAADPRVTAVQDEFASEVTYLNTASCGLPPRRSWDALQRSLSQWRAGRADVPGYDLPLESARRTYAGLVGVDPSTVAVGSTVSALAGLVAAALPDGAEVLAACDDFTSVTFPFMAHAHRGVVVREVPLEQLVGEVDERTALVAVSAVQSVDGRVLDLDALADVADRTGTRVLLDLTQAAGWLPVDASRFAYTVCGGYKWLLTARGTAYLTVRPEAMDDLVPLAAGWYAGEDRWSSIYGGPLRLAPDARRFDVSPAWHSWVAAAPALELLAEVGVPALHAHAVRLADRFCDEVGVARAGSGIVSVAVDDVAAAAAMAAADVSAAMRAGRLRLAFHVSTSDDDVDRAVAALAPHVRTG